MRNLLLALLVMVAITLAMDVYQTYVIHSVVDAFSEFDPMSGELSSEEEYWLEMGTELPEGYSP